MKMICPVCREHVEAMITDPKFGTACSICIEECYESEDDKVYKKRRSKSVAADDDEDDDETRKGDLTRGRSHDRLY